MRRAVGPRKKSAGKKSPRKPKRSPTGAAIRKGAAVREAVREAGTDPWVARYLAAKEENTSNVEAKAKSKAEAKATKATEAAAVKDAVASDAGGAKRKQKARANKKARRKPAVVAPLCTRAFRAAAAMVERELAEVTFKPVLNPRSVQVHYRVLRAQGGCVAP